MPTIRIVTISTTLVLLIALGSCRDHHTPEQKARDHHAAAHQALSGAQIARTEKKNPKAAEQLAVLAEKAAAKLDTLVAKSPASPELESLQKETRTAATEARLTADLTREEATLAAALTSLKAHAYRTAANAAIATVVGTMTLAADQAAKKPLDELPESVQKAALASADFIQNLTARPPTPDGSPDWPAIAADLHSLAHNDFHLLLALGLALAGNDTLALVEIEQVDPTKLNHARAQLTYHILRAILLHNHGCRRLAEQQLETLATNSEFSSRELLAGTHLLMAFIAMLDKDNSRVELELTRAMNAWPDNPITVYLTGERLAADGQWEKAADSLETALAGTKDKWLAAAIAERARVIR
ncbi:MAG: hypothetical protein FWD53_10785, partial [Phycisphaerales bacterium]|nr:hypothetical protein [Phycisphaerales bacterium]